MFYHSVFVCVCFYEPFFYLLFFPLTLSLISRMFTEVPFQSSINTAYILGFQLALHTWCPNVVAQTHAASKAFLQSTDLEYISKWYLVTIYSLHIFNRFNTLRPEYIFSAN